MKILCTGSPVDNTVASAVKRLFDSAEFASRTTGYDLRFWDPGSETHFRTNVVNYDVFINSSFICNGAQMQLLEATHEEWSRCDISGHIVNIGSTAEWLGSDSEFGKYSVEKRALRDRSLQLNGRNQIKTTHITVGGINDGLPGHEHWLDLDHVADAIGWVLTRNCQIPLLAVVK